MRCIPSGRIASRAGTSIPIGGTTTRARASTTSLSTRPCGVRRAPSPGRLILVERAATRSTRARSTAAGSRRASTAVVLETAAPRTTPTIRRGRPHAGIIYTPPTWSDHVAVSLLLTRVPVSTEQAPKKAAGDAQPHARVARASRPSSRRGRPGPRRRAPTHAASGEKTQEDDPGLRRQNNLTGACVLLWLHGVLRSSSGSSTTAVRTGAGRCMGVDLRAGEGGEGGAPSRRRQRLRRRRAAPAGRRAVLLRRSRGLLRRNPILSSHLLTRGCGRRRLQTASPRTGYLKGTMTRSRTTFG